MKKEREQEEKKKVNNSSRRGEKLRKSKHNTPWERKTLRRNELRIERKALEKKMRKKWIKLV